ncbi:MAG: hypothetical protein RI988_4145 [Pseudomonadota bacterium]|jgi:hypothetical protein
MSHYVFGKLVSLPFDVAVQRITEELPKVRQKLEQALAQI